MKVAKVIDCYRLAITKRDGPFLGLGDILVVGTEDIIDPETGEVIGHWPGLRVKVIDVYDHFVVAETYRLLTDTKQVVVQVQVGDSVWPYTPGTSPSGSG